MLILNHDWQFLPKPFMFQALKQKIEQMLDDNPKSNRDPADFGSPGK